MIGASLLLLADLAVATPAPWTAVVRSDAQGHRSATASATSTDGSARLVVRCDVRQSKVVSVQFIPRAGFAATTDRPVSLSFDGGSPLGWNWEYPGGGAFVRIDAIVTNLVNGIAHARQIAVRAIGPTNEPVVATFAGPGQRCAAPPGARRLRLSAGRGAGSLARSRRPPHPPTDAFPPLEIHRC